MCCNATCTRNLEVYKESGAGYIPPVFTQCSVIWLTLRVGPRTGCCTRNPALRHGCTEPPHVPGAGSIRKRYPGYDYYALTLHTIAGSRESSRRVYARAYDECSYIYMTKILNVETYLKVASSRSDKQKYVCLGKIIQVSSLLTPVGPQSRFGDKPFKFKVFCPQNGL